MPMRSIIPAIKHIGPQYLDYSECVFIFGTGADVINSPHSHSTTRHSPTLHRCNIQKNQTKTVKNTYLFLCLNTKNSLMQRRLNFKRDKYNDFNNAT
jgi:hypothetical protein